MGFICETNSDVLNFEERGESVRLYANEEGHVFPTQRFYDPATEVSGQIRNRVLEEAQKRFTEGQDEHARVYREIAELIDKMRIDQPPMPRSVELSKEFVQGLVAFLEDNPDRIE